MIYCIQIENAKAATDEMLDSVRAQVGYPAIVKPNKGSGSAGEDGAGVPLELETETNEGMTTRRFLIPTKAFSTTAFTFKTLLS